MGNFNYSMLVRCSFLCIAVLLCSGCSDASRRPGQVPVSGTILLDQAPLESGEILFIGTDNAETVGCQVTEGQFSCRLMPGPKRVQIVSTVNTGALDVQGMPVIYDLIPEKYRTDSPLTAEIPGGGIENLRFELTQQ